MLAYVVQLIAVGYNAIKVGGIRIRDILYPVLIVSSLYGLSILVSYLTYKFSLQCPENDDSLELTNITLSDGKIRISMDCKEETWLKQYDCFGKFIIEIWSKLVVLEVEKIKINDEIYTL